MYDTDGKLQLPVRVDSPSPLFAGVLQQAIGGVEGEIRAPLQYFFQAGGERGPQKYREMLLSTATEEIAPIEMLATAFTLYLEGAPPYLQSEAARQDPAVAAVLGGMNASHFLSAGLAALPVNADGVPSDTSHVCASGNTVGDMLANATAEATGRRLSTRLYELTDDTGMKDMLAFQIARDTMLQQQWLAVIEELGGYEASLPVLNSFPQDLENQEFNYFYIDTRLNPDVPIEGRFTSGESLDGTGGFSIQEAEPLRNKPVLAPPSQLTFPQKSQLEGADADGTTES